MNSFFDLLVLATLFTPVTLIVAGNLAAYRSPSSGAGSSVPTGRGRGSPATMASRRRKARSCVARRDARSGKCDRRDPSCRENRISSPGRGAARTRRLDWGRLPRKPVRAMNTFALLVSLSFFVPIALTVAMNVTGMRPAA